MGLVGSGMEANALTRAAARRKAGTKESTTGKGLETSGGSAAPTAGYDDADNCGADEDRTHGLQSAILALSQLSYSPTHSTFVEWAGILLLRRGFAILKWDTLPEIRMKRG